METPLTPAQTEEWATICVTFLELRDAQRACAGARETLSALLQSPLPDRPTVVQDWREWCAYTDADARRAADLRDADARLKALEEAIEHLTALLIARLPSGVWFQIGDAAVGVSVNTASARLHVRAWGSDLPALTFMQERAMREKGSKRG